MAWLGRTRELDVLERLVLAGWGEDLAKVRVQPADVRVGLFGTPAGQVLAGKDAIVAPTASGGWVPVVRGDVLADAVELSYPGLREALEDDPAERSVRATGPLATDWLGRLFDRIISRGSSTDQEAFAGEIEHARLVYAVERRVGSLWHRYTSPGPGARVVVNVGLRATLDGLLNASGLPIFQRLLDWLAEARAIRRNETDLDDDEIRRARIQDLDSWIDLFVLVIRQSTDGVTSGAWFRLRELLNEASYRPDHAAERDPNHAQAIVELGVSLAEIRARLDVMLASWWTQEQLADINWHRGRLEAFEWRLNVPLTGTPEQHSEQRR